MIKRDDTNTLLQIGANGMGRSDFWIFGQQNRRKTISQPQLIDPQIKLVFFPPSRTLKTSRKNMQEPSKFLQPS